MSIKLEKKSFAAPRSSSESKGRRYCRMGKARKIIPVGNALKQLWVCTQEPESALSTDSGEGIWGFKELMHLGLLKNCFAFQSELLPSPKGQGLDNNNSHRFQHRETQLPWALTGVTNCINWVTFSNCYLLTLATWPFKL